MGIETSTIRMGERPRPSANLHPEPADNIDPKTVVVVVVVGRINVQHPEEREERRRGSIIGLLFLFSSRSR